MYSARCDITPWFVIVHYLFCCSPQIYISEYPDTSYVIIQKDPVGPVTYPLQMGMTYEVEVRAYVWY